MLLAQPEFPVFLFPNHISDELRTILKEKGITCITKSSLSETANDQAFLESKYMGTLALLLAQGKPFLIDNAVDLITKKGGLSLSFHFSKRAPNIPYKFILVNNLDKDPEPKSKEAQLLENIPVENRLTFEQLSKFDLTDICKMKFDTSKIKVTCGFLTHHRQGEKEFTGHMTRGFGKSIEEAAMLEENNSNILGKNYKATVIKVVTGDKDGGSVVMVPDLGTTAHITNNTTIKSVLSGPVVEKYCANIFEFDLKDIDATAKQQITIKLNKLQDTEVLIQGWYVYAV